MAPEQFDDDRPTRAMDVYSFGATLYFALVGRAPFSAVGIRSLLKEKEAGCPALEIAGLERPAVEALRSSMDVEAANRPESCGELLQMLQANSLSSMAIPQLYRSLDQNKEKPFHEAESVSKLATRINPAESAKSDDKLVSDLPTKPDSNSLSKKIDSSAEDELGNESDLLDSLTWVFGETPEISSSDVSTTSKEKSAGYGWFRRIFPEKSKTLETLTNSIGMKFRLIKPGAFMMGSPEWESGRCDDERQHKVTLTRPYYLGVYPVTQEEYQRVMGNNPSRFKGKRRPVENVRWCDAIEFISKLNELESKVKEPFLLKYRLPTEAEWEYACRAGSTTAFCFGDSESELWKYAWYHRTNFIGKTHSVGKKRPNIWGLFDMHGNVHEWCSDFHGGYHHDVEVNPCGEKKPLFFDDRVFRGGTFGHEAHNCRSAKRFSWFSNPNPLIGFRVALEEEIDF
jgi:formylglycine-generating enzyme required for sulfatase activity